MSIRVAVEHHTSYAFEKPVRLAPHTVRLRPAPHCRTPILAYSLRVTPESRFLSWQQDPAGNHVARLVFPEPATALTVTVDLVADMTVINPFDFFVEEPAKQWPFAYDADLARDLAPYLEPEQGGPRLDAWVAGVTRSATPVIDFLVDLNRRVLGDVDYSLRMEPGVQAPDETLRRGVGSCRDSAWLLVQILRRLGIAARFASGYLVQLVPDGQAGDDFTDLHAWAEAYVPGAGWVGLDPTSGLLAGEGHIPLACASRTALAAPITGSVESGAETTFTFANTVRRLHEDPRVTRPYGDAEWARIDALGARVDAALRAGDVRLTMGGEPTFVAREGVTEPEWSIAADGPTKRGLAVKLTKELTEVFAPGALLLHGQGKWYPGEPLPRWQIGVHWRRDGEPVWRDPRLLADPSIPGAATAADAERLAGALTAALGIPADAAVPAYEDPISRLWTEARLPAGDPPAPELDPALPPDRAALVAELDADTGDPVGWAIPLHRRPGDATWATGRWHLRRGHLFLLGGDSPIGVRLPLDALTWRPPVPDPEPSRFAPRPDRLASGRAPVAERDDPPPHTALCVQERGGHVHVFLPPLDDVEHALELVGIVEEAAAGARLPVVVEGYAPPGDPRVARFEVAPDPGVIEVNIHPSASWPELTERTSALFAAADRAGLAAEKFALDGLHAGTGGGNHLTLGGATPPDSPFLRRPDLLRSLVTYWQHHPSLSYLFSGRFVGPTSQAPRVDEARDDSLYELEIAFAELDRLSAQGSPPAWRVDRALRNLLVDLTGNTHRAEFCIDKLYSPDSERGRLGLLELRAFEMPPHPRMALVQALLVRALIARCWDEPYRAPLVRWGTDLHDRFMLPHYLEADIADVARDLTEHGLDFDPAWLDPFLAFRFPRLGVAHVDGVTVELRQALEPWHVLGEETSGGGTARYVDSSVERLQVKVGNLTPSRHLVTCNHRVVPLQPTAAAGTFVAGVRFRAWQPPSALHPTIGVHSPLVFDVVDRWSSRALGGCTYHVVHPGGRAYETLPVNANEAEARRASRFEPFGHTPGRVEPPAPLPPTEFPRTLDLRRA